MQKIIIYIVAVIALASCGSSYNISGTANNVPGSMLYLKVLNADALEFVDIDSAEIVHGNFHFTGTIDSIQMATIASDRAAFCPIVIESGDVVINDGRTFSGSPLNELLSEFWSSYSGLLAELSDLDRRPAQAILNGEELDQQQFELDLLTIEEKMDSLVSKSIEENFDNVLGPGIFFLTTQGYQYPVLAPWMEHLLAKATDAFKNDTYVRMYVEKAREIEAYENGLLEPAAAQPEQEEAIAPAPTPNELAGTDDTASEE